MSEESKRVLDDREVMEEIRNAIRFYDRRGRNWVYVVGFLLHKHWNGL